MDALKPGLTGEKTFIVEQRHTAAHLGSGGVPVFATPMMILAMEEAAVDAVDRLLEPGQATVGYHLDVKHIAATPMGMRITARAELLAVDGKMLTFRVEAYDEREKIGEGSHTRAIIQLDRFKEKVEKKAAR